MCGITERSFVDFVISENVNRFRIEVLGADDLFAGILSIYTQILAVEILAVINVCLRVNGNAEVVIKDKVFSE